MNEWGRMMRVSEPWVSAPPTCLVPGQLSFLVPTAAMIRSSCGHAGQTARRQGGKALHQCSRTALGGSREGAHKPLSRDGRPRPPSHPSRHGSGGVRTTSPLAATHHLGRVWEPALPACADLHAPPQAAVPDVERPEAHG